MIDTEKKEFAKRLRYHAFAVGDMTIDEQHNLADELDPPRPKPGGPLWYRQIGTTDFFHGVATQDGEGVFGPYGRYVWSEIEWKPAHILAPGQVAVTRDDIKTAIDALYGCGYPAQAARLKVILDNCMEAINDKRRGRGAGPTAGFTSTHG